MPSDERSGLRLQMRRAAISIASNIAEGEGRRSWRDHAHFVVQARGSLYELETQIAADLKKLHDDEHSLKRTLAADTKKLAADAKKHRTDGGSSSHKKTEKHSNHKPTTSGHHT